MLAVAVRAGASRAFGMFMVRHDAPAPFARVIAGGYFNAFARSFLRGRRPIPPPLYPPQYKKKKKYSCATDVQLLWNDCDSTNTSLYLISSHQRCFPGSPFDFDAIGERGIVFLCFFFYMIYDIYIYICIT